MSRQDARSFVERVANDAEFRRLVSPSAETRDVERVIAIGAEHGLRFTASELDEAAKEQRFGRNTRAERLPTRRGGWRLVGWVSWVRRRPTRGWGGVAGKPAASSLSIARSLPWDLSHDGRTIKEKSEVLKR